MNLHTSLQKLADKLENWLDSAIVMLPNLAVALVVVLIFYIAARILRRVSTRVLSRFTAQAQINRFISNILVIITLTIGVVAALGILNLDKAVTSLLAGAGIVGIALGFAFQDFAANIISGVVLTLRRPFRIGDIIKSGEFTGMVEKIDLRTTTILTFQGQSVLIPNQKIFQNPIINFTITGRRRVDIMLSVAHNQDLEQVRTLTLAAVKKLEYIEQDYGPDLYFKEFTTSAVNFELRFWIDFSRQSDYLRAQSDAIMNIKAAYGENGILLPPASPVVEIRPGEKTPEAAKTAPAQDSAKQ